MNLLRRSFSKDDVTAVVLSTGELTTRDAITSLNRQSLPVRDVVVVRDRTPFHAALNAAVDQVRTPFFVQVDADMILDRHCVEALRKNVRSRVGVVVGRLRDALIGQTVGIKLFRTACFNETKFRDTIAPDSDFVDDLARAGWSTIYIGQRSNSWATFGEHRPDYAPAYTYKKYLLEGARYRYRQKPEGLRWHFGTLEESGHPSALIAQIALTQGLFFAENRDLLGVHTHDADFLRIWKFISSEQNGSPPYEVKRIRDVPERDVFGAYYRLGKALISAAASRTFKDHMRALNNVAHDQRALLSKIALCRGLSAPDGDMPETTIAADHRAVDYFLSKRSVLVQGGDTDFDISHESFDLEAIATYAIDAQLKRFVVDGPLASEYQTDYSVEPPALQNTGSSVASVVDRNGRPRIKLPFRPFGQIICTQPERINGIFWCWDALRAGYVFVHLPSLSGPKKVSVIRELAKNCLVRSGYRASSLQGVPSPPAARTKLPSLTRKRRPEYQPIPRRILMVTSTFARGGSELQMVAIAEALIKRGYDVRILALWSLQPDEPDIGQEIIKIGIQPQLWSDFTSSVTRSQWSRCPSTRAPNWSGLPRWFVERAYAVELAIRQIRPSVVHGWLDLPGVIVAATGCTLGAPRVVVGQCTTHEHVKTYGAEVADLVWEAYRAISRNPSVAILNNSAAAARGYERWLRLGAEKIEVLPNCYWPQRMRVPTREETAEFRASLGITRKAPAVGTIMRLVPDKDPRLWVDTAQKIAQARPDVRFIIAGSGVLQEAITRQIEMLGMADRFTLLGTVSDVGLVYSALDVVLLTSIVEGVPNVLIEAQAAGTPVVTTAVGGAREGVLDGHTGLVVGERSPAQLAQAVLSILDDPAWHDRVRVAGPEFVEGRFAGDRIVSRLLEIYGYPPQAI